MTFVLSSRRKAIRVWNHNRRLEKTAMNCLLEMMAVSEAAHAKNETIARQKRLLRAWQVNLLGSGASAEKLRKLQEEKALESSAITFADKLMAVVDADGDGEVSACELSWCIKTKGFGDIHFEEAARWLKQTPGKFKQYDIRGNGNIARDDFVRAMIEYFRYSWQYQA